jgi:hypothetical protein
VFQQNAPGWDPIRLYTGVDIITGFYVLFLLAAVIVGTVRMVKLWIAAPPFLLARQTGNPTYLRTLEASSSSTRQWMGCTLLFGGLVLSYFLATFGRTFPGSKATVAVLLLESVRYLGTVSFRAFFVTFLLFLAQWHMQVRIQHLRK